MNHFSKKEGGKRNSVIFMILAFVLLFNTVVFAQTTNLNMKNESKEFLNNSGKMDAIKQESNSDISNLNFVLWFMGAKQDSDAIALPVRTTEMKQFRTSGTAPNRFLIKIFLRKAMNSESVIV